MSSKRGFIYTKRNNRGENNLISFQSNGIMLKGKKSKSNSPNLPLQVCICFIICCLTAAVYLEVKDFEFINYDDPDYVSENLHVHKGLTFDNIKWAFTSIVSANWHPLTMISHMLDCHLFGLQPGFHHLVNLFLHVLNILLLFRIFHVMTSKCWTSAFLTALFALHPLHVESVAWVSERKDVLSTFFWFLTIWSYIRYVHQKKAIHYFIAIFFLGLGLMAKPMIVTLPFVLLLFDFWPLQRIRLEFNRADSGKPFYNKLPFDHRLAVQLIFEKLPFFFLIIVTSIVTFVVQKSGGAFESSRTYTLTTKLSNAVSSYIIYILKALWPFKLAVFYPHPGITTILFVVFSIITLLGISIAAVLWAKKYPWLFVGWFFYLGTLIPVIGIVQVGEQCMADRYTYIPLIGIFIILVWGSSAILHEKKSKIFLFTAGLVLILLLSVVTAIQVGYWRNSIILFQHALKVTRNNYVAHMSLGEALETERNDIYLAMAHYKSAIQIKPFLAEAHNNLGSSFYKLGHIPNAIKHYKVAIKLFPDFTMAHTNLGGIFSEKGRSAEAIYHFKEALRNDPESVTALNNVAIELAKQWKTKEAKANLQKALALNPGSAITHFNLGRVLDMSGNIDAAIFHFRKAVSIEPNLKIARKELQAALLRSKSIKRKD